MSKTTDTQKDTKSFSVPVTEELSNQMIDKFCDDSKEELQRNFNQWDDTFRASEETIQDAEKGFLGEAAMSQLLEEADVEHTWGGDVGEADIDVNGKTFDVKTRASTCEYRNLIKDEKMSNTDSVDFYVLANAHYHPLNNDIVSIEFLGYIRNEDVEKHGEPVQLYGHDAESDKLEVHPRHLNPISKLLNLL